MVVGHNLDQGLLADVIFVIEGTASNGAYISEFKTNYIIPTLEYFSQGSIEERDYVTESTSALYALVVFYASDCLPYPSSDCYGPYSSPQKLLSILDSLEMAGGRGESHANVAEGLATSLQCIEDLQQRREPGASSQKHCILVCNSPPYLLPAVESLNFAGHTAEQLASLLQENGANLSILSPRKIPALFKLFEKAGGDLSTSQTKNYAKDPRHLVLLKGFSLKERPLSPAPVPGNQNPQIPPMTSPNIGSPVPPPPVLQSTPPAAVFRAMNPVAAAQLGPGTPGRPPHMQYPPPQNLPYGGPQPQQQQPGMVGMRPPCQITPTMDMRGPTPRWQMPPQQNTQQIAAMMQQQQQQQQQQQMHRFPGSSQQNQGSALIAQLTQPPSGVNVLNPAALNQQFGPRMDGGPPGPTMSAMQQQQLQQQQAQAQAQAQQQQQHAQQQQAQMLAQQNLRMAQALGPGTPMSSQPPPPPPQQQQQPNQQQQQQQPPQASQMSHQPPPAPSVAAGQQPMGRERQTIWQGTLEWIEKAKNANDAQKVTRNVPCQVSANTRDGEPELRADSWPPKLLMQLMPKQLIGNIGGAYLKNSKSVLFHPQQCDALDALTKVMSSGFAGCVHFTSLPNLSMCDIKVLILLYTAEKRAYLGFIPNDQTAFVDRLRKVIQQQKSSQAMRQQQGVGIGVPGPPGGMPNLPSGGPAQQQPVQQQQQQQQPGMMMSQTNPMAMGGVQLTQNPLTSTGQMQQQLSGLGSQPGGPQHPQMGMQVGFESAESHMVGPGGQTPGSGVMRGAQGMLGPQQQQQQQQQQQSQQQAAQQQSQQQQQQQQQRMPGPAGQQQQSVPQPGTVSGQQQTQQQQQPQQPQNPQGQGGQGMPKQLEEARQLNLRKIQQLRHTLEQAQQQEQQYKNQLEIISHMKIQQLQQTLEHAQQQETQFKLQMEEEQKQQLRAQLEQLRQQQHQRQMAPQGQAPPMQPQGIAPQQQRIMRAAATMPANPGLRHLLQQQSQYRTQVMAMNQMGGPRQMTPQQQQQQTQQSQGQFPDDSFDFLG